MLKISNQSSRKSFILLLSVIFHLGLLYKANHWYLASKEVKQPQAINIHFHIHTAPEKKQEPKPVPAKKEIRQKPEKKKTIKPRPKPRRIVKKTSKKPVTPTKVIKRTPSPVTPKPEEQPVVTKQTVTTSPEPAPAPDPVTNVALRTQYLEKLLTWIEQNKVYPAYARRRRIEGDVEVSFTLSSDLKIRNEKFEGGHPVLQGAARDTLFESGKLPEPPEGLSFPIKVHYKMRFTLVGP